MATGGTAEIAEEPTVRASQDPYRLGPRDEAIEEWTGGSGALVVASSAGVDLIQLAEADRNESARDAEASVILDDIWRKRVRPVSGTVEWPPDAAIGCHDSAINSDGIQIALRPEQVSDRF